MCSLSKGVQALLLILSQHWHWHPSSLLVSATTTCGEARIVEEEKTSGVWTAERLLRVEGPTRWMAEEGGFFVIDLGCQKIIKGIKVDNSEHTNGVATKELRILVGNNEAGDWEEIYKNSDMEYVSGIEILMDKQGPYQYLRVEGNKAKEGVSNLVSLKSFEPIFEEVEQDCDPPTIVEQYGTMSEDASDVLNRDNRQWRAEPLGYFIIDLGCIAAVDSIEIDNREQNGDFTETLDISGGESKLGPWKSIYYTWYLKPDPNIVLEINNPGPYRFLKVVARSAEFESDWVGFYYFYPKVQKTTGGIFDKEL